MPGLFTIHSDFQYEITRKLSEGGMGIHYLKANLLGDGKVDPARPEALVYLPEYVVGHWWEQLLHNQSALRLKARLLFQRGVMVTSVPWQLASSRADDRQPPLPPEPSPAVPEPVAAHGRITDT